MFLVHDFDEVLVSSTAAGHSFRNPCERCHCIANIRLNGIGVMRDTMSPDFEKLMKNKNTTDEIRTLCNVHENFKKALEKSLAPPIELMKDVFSRISLKGVPFQFVDPATLEEIQKYSDSLKMFEKGVDSLTEKKEMTKFPRFEQFLKGHTVGTYYFQVFKCKNTECKFHKSLRGDEPTPIGDPIPFTDDEGNDPEETYISSKLEDVTKRNHGMDFSPSAQTALNVGMVIKCSERKKPRLSDIEKGALKRFLSSFEYICGSSFKKVPHDAHPNIDIIKKVFVRENLSCTSIMESSYYSCKIHPLVRVKCGKSNKLLPPDVTFYPQCEKCTTERVKASKRKAVREEELGKKNSENYSNESI